jgi:hypothetical protein
MYALLEDFQIAQDAEALVQFTGLLGLLTQATYYQTIEAMIPLEEARGYETDGQPVSVCDADLTPQLILTILERMFLKRLLFGRWTSPPRFNHGVVSRLVDAGYVQTVSLSPNVLQYEITEAGRAAAA